MSHQPERLQKNCLNCGATVIGRFCHKCGQENIETKESFWSLARHFIFDIFHFDGGFFTTLKDLFARPGFVAKEYTNGKRASFLHPIRMYLFTSAIFFLIFINYSNTVFTRSVDLKSDTLTWSVRKDIADNIKGTLTGGPSDSSKRNRIAFLLDSTKVVKRSDLTGGHFNLFDEGGVSYKSIEAYDSSQRVLPAGKRSGWLARKFAHKAITLSSRYENDGNELFHSFLEVFLHKLPYMLFVSLPFFALILKLLYIRRKNFYYSDHAIFTLYHYIFSFIVLLLVLGLNTLHSVAGWGILNTFITLMISGWFIYSYLELKFFYNQGYFKTFAKFILLNFLGFITILILFVGFLFLAIFQM